MIFIAMPNWAPDRIEICVSCNKEFDKTHCGMCVEEDSWICKDCFNKHPLSKLNIDRILDKALHETGKEFLQNHKGEEMND